MSRIAEDRRIIVCAGTGGVGKTTTAAAIALDEARLGRKVLVLTIDPSRRLAEALGVRRNTPEPVRAPATVEGELWAWMLDPKQVSDQTVRRLARTPEDAERLMANRIYQQATLMVAGMQEYTAMVALQRFIDEGRYDLVVLDTPPSRNALNFLEAPGRLSSFLDGRIFRLMVPRDPNKRRGTTRKLVDTVLSTVFGEQLHDDLQVFFGAFAGLLQRLGGDAQTMRARLQQDDVAFILVTSPASEAVEEARHFAAQLVSLGIPLSAVVLNRTQGVHGRREVPQAPADASPVVRSALAKLRVLADREAVIAHRDLSMVTDLAQNAPVILLPDLGSEIESTDGLLLLAGWLDKQPEPA